MFKLTCIMKQRSIVAFGNVTDSASPLYLSSLPNLRALKRKEAICSETGVSRRLIFHVIV